MTVHLHVERVVLHGIELEAGGADALRAAVCAELVRLLSERDPLPGAPGGAVPLMRAAPVRLESGASPQQIGTRVARAVYGSLGP
jgi:hypothetical protein